MELVARLLQGIPSRVSRRRAVARVDVEIGTAVRAQPLAVFTTLHERWDREEPRLADRRPQIDLAGALVEEKHVRIILGRRIALGGEERMHLLLDIRGHRGEAAPALE